MNCESFIGQGKNGKTVLCSVHTQFMFSYLKSNTSRFQAGRYAGEGTRQLELDPSCLVFVETGDRWAFYTSEVRCLPGPCAVLD